MKRAKGQYLHSEVLIPTLASALFAAGAQVFVEHRVPGGGFLDLLAIQGACRLAVEVEGSPARVHRDVAKAVAAKATALYIVTPDAKVARACQRRLARLGPPTAPLAIEVFPLGRAVFQLKDLFKETLS